MAFIYGTPNDDWIAPSGSSPGVSGSSTPDADTIFGYQGNDTIYGGHGDNVLDGGSDDDLVQGDSGNDKLWGGFGNDTLYGIAGNNSLYGELGNDSLTGGGGRDWLDGGGGADTMDGGNYNDVYFVDDAGDVAEELSGSYNAGIDLVYASVSHGLGVGIEKLTLLGTSNINGTGNFDHNDISGNSGDNVLSGGAGNDSLKGGTGSDKLDGGAGDDRFVYAFASESSAVDGHDLILGFDFGSTLDPADKVDLSAIDANSGVSGNQAFSTGTGTAVGQLSFVNLANGNTLIRGNTSSLAGFELEIEVVDGSKTAAYWNTALDFVL